MKQVLLFLISFYRAAISPLFPPTCRYVPTCSAYAMTAIARYGARRGGMLALLLRRAFDEGGREAWLLTTTAAPFFERAGFKPMERTSAPASVLATRQAANLCPASAALLRRSIHL